MLTLRNKKVFLFFALFSFLAVGVHAQELSKEEQKKWKDLAKEYKKNPMALKVLTEKSEGLDAELSQLNAEIGQVQQENNSLQAQMNRKDARIADMQAQVNQLNMKITELQANMEANAAKGGDDMSNTGNMQGEDMMGVLYRVQIGAFEKPLNDGVATADNVNVEAVDNLKKVMVGKLRDYQAAVDLRDQMRKMGVKDAFIVAYKDGNRVTIKEALGS
jgi:septal ring factor EnvC (AmiA/AmiB activator)